MLCHGLTSPASPVSETPLHSLYSALSSPVLVSETTLHSLYRVSKKSVHANQTLTWSEPLDGCWNLTYERVDHLTCLSEIWSYFDKAFLRYSTVKLGVAFLGFRWPRAYLVCAKLKNKIKLIYWFFLSPRDVTTHVLVHQKGFHRVGETGKTRKKKMIREKESDKMFQRLSNTLNCGRPINYSKWLIIYPEIYQ